MPSGLTNHPSAAARPPPIHTMLGNLFLQSAAIAYLYHRNDTWDRRNLIFHAPLAVVVLLQCLFDFTQSTNVRQEHLAFADPHLYTCTTTNRVLSFAMALAFLFLPYWFNQVTRFETKVHDTEYAFDPKKLPPWEEAIGRAPKVIWNSIKLLSLGTTVTYYLCNFTLFYVYFLSGNRGAVVATCSHSGNATVAMVDVHVGGQGHHDKEPCSFNVQVPEPYFALCTTHGPHHGRLILPFLIWPNIYVQYALYLGYFGLLGSFQYMPRPTMLPQTLALCVWAVPVLIWRYQDEWSSVWVPCVSLVLCGLYLVEPRVVKWGKVLDTDMLEHSHEAHVRRGGKYGGFMAWWQKKLTYRQVLFRILWTRFIVWKWHPWRDKTLEKKDEEARLNASRERVAEHAAELLNGESESERKRQGGDEGQGVWGGDSDRVGRDKGNVSGVESKPRMMSRAV